MGGTSTDVSLVMNGTPEYTTKRKVCGLPSGIPMIDVHAVGAGGGSIAHLDNAGALKVGPESAGADPGPAAYGLGGENPVVTDANIVLGRINPTHFLGGRMTIHADLARKVISEKLASPMNMTVEQAASGIISVVNSNMARAIRVITVERGYNPSDFTLVALWRRRTASRGISRERNEHRKGSSSAQPRNALFSRSSDSRHTQELCPHQHDELRQLFSRCH